MSAHRPHWSVKELLAKDMPSGPWLANRLQSADLQDYFAFRTRGASCILLPEASGIVQNARARPQFTLFSRRVILRTAARGNRRTKKAGT